MAGPKNFSVRQASVAGMFYPSDPARCEADAEALVAARGSSHGSAVGQNADDGGAIGLGGVVPHAGWMCSGAIAGAAIGHLARSRSSQAAPDVVVVFGAVHTPLELKVAALQSYEVWAIPGADVRIALDLNEGLLRHSDLFAIDDRFHRHEHAVEVEVPLIRAVWPDARLLPIEVPAVISAGDMGRHTARLLSERGLRSVFLASSDLTHYGPAYHFAPAGVGLAAMQWASENDWRLLRLIERLEVDGILPEVRQNMNACGGGAIVAMLAACMEIGASGARVLRHASSFQTLAKVAPQPPVDAVGYAAVVVH